MRNSYISQASKFIYNIITYDKRTRNQFRVMFLTQSSKIGWRVQLTNIKIVMYTKIIFNLKG